MRFARDREHMVEAHLIARGIRDERVLEAFRQIPREAFIPEALRAQAYADYPLPIGAGQTISQPLIVAQMLELLELHGDERVLEVGVGSGYQTALLAVLCRWVFGIERHVSLLTSARSVIEGMGLSNVALKGGDGTLGWKEMAPFNAIIVSAAAPDVPQPLIDQLAPGGRLVVPVGEESLQHLYCITRDAEGNLSSDVRGGCRFVPLIGRFGWEKGAV